MASIYEEFSLETDVPFTLALAVRLTNKSPRFYGGTVVNLFHSCRKTFLRFNETSHFLFNWLVK